MSKRIDPITTSRARSLRTQMTAVEHLLWQALRGRQIRGYRFRRQHPIAHYIADFACIERRLVVELDGGQHQQQVAYDEQRSADLRADLRANGWRVLRFWSHEVVQNLSGILEVIDAALNSPPPP